MNTSQKSSAGLRLPLSERILHALGSNDLDSAAQMLQASVLSLMDQSERTPAIQDAHVAIVALTVTTSEAVAVKKIMESLNDMLDTLSAHEERAMAKGKQSELALLATVRALIEMDVRRLQGTLSANVRAVRDGLFRLPVASALSALDDSHGR